MVGLQTLVQFENTWRMETIKEYGCTRREYDANYPRGARLSQWLETITDACRQGDVLPARILDDIERRCGEAGFFSFRHGHQRNVPADYLPPSARKRQKRLADEMRAARRQGKNYSKKVQVA